MKLNSRKLILMLFFVPLMISCNPKIDIKPVETTSQTVFITGKVLNPTLGNNTVTIYVIEILSGRQNTYVSSIDKSGNFQLKFNQYYPQDVLIRYGDNSFPIMVHPKDSIHIVFDADKISDLEELAKTILFSGSLTNDNPLMMAFRAELYKTSIPQEQYSQYEKVKNPDEFISILNSLKNVRMEIANKFIQQGVSIELEEWIRNDVEFDYYNSLARYPNNHAQSNNLDEKTVVPTSFYNFMNTHLSPEKLYNSQLMFFVSLYRFARIGALMVDNGSLVKYNNGWIYKGDSNKAIIRTIQENTDDDLLKELLIARELYKMLDRRDLKDFERHYSLFDKMATLPFLQEPLINKYVETKRHVEDPQLEGNSLLKSAKDTPVDQFISKIVEDHQGKIIFLDIWATWCSPCREEMPYSIELMNTLNSDKVAFVYLCTDSEEDQWKALISELNIEGSHYLATPDQSRFLYQLFEMNGVPEYILIDEKGNILEKGGQLRPSQGMIKTKIQDLLEQ